MSDVFVAKARPTPMERIQSGVSVQTASLEFASAATARGLEAADYAAMVAGVRNPIAAELIWVMLEDADAIGRAVEQLDLWGWMQLRRTRRDVRLSPKQHRRLCFAAVSDYRQGSPGYTLAGLGEFVGVEAAEVKRLMGHWSELASHLLNCEQVLISHLRRQMREDA